MEFNETWLEAKSQHPLQSLCFLGWWKKQDASSGLWLAETFSTSLKPLNGIRRNLTGSKISTSSTKFVFNGPIGKTRWPPWPLIGWDIFDFSSETAEWNLTKLDRKQDLNVLYQVCVFRADRKNKMANPSKRWHIVLRCTICGPLGLLLAHLSRRLEWAIVIVHRRFLCLCITDALEYGVPRCANCINNWRLQLGKRVCNLYNRKSNCID